MRASVFVFATAGGLVWGAIAVALILAMFRELMPAYAELFLPVAVLSVIATLPFQAAVWALTLLGRSSPGLYEVVVATLTVGAVLGVLIVATIRAVSFRRASGG